MHWGNAQWNSFRTVSMQDKFETCYDKIELLTGAGSCPPTWRTQLVTVLKSVNIALASETRVTMLWLTDRMWPARRFKLEHMDRSRWACQNSDMSATKLVCFLHEPIKEFNIFMSFLLRSLCLHVVWKKQWKSLICCQESKII
jgi:hypothetical protein